MLLTSIIRSTTATKPSSRIIIHENTKPSIHISTQFLFSTTVTSITSNATTTDATLNATGNDPTKIGWWRENNNSLQFNHSLANNDIILLANIAPIITNRIYNIDKMLNLTTTVANMFNSRKQNKLPKISDPLLLQPAHKLSKQIKDGSVSICID